jgi:hypothetical protein
MDYGPQIRGNGYLARQELERLYQSMSLDSKRLEPFGYKVYSQGDEDGIINEIFNRLGIEKGTFAEIGVESGLECNTHLLLHRGWTGTWIDGNVDQSWNIKNKFKSLVDAKRLNVGIGRITRENVNQIFNDLRIDSVDFLSIDIDGMDIYILEAINIKPKVICIEYNSKWPANVSRAPVYNPNYQWQGSDYMGSSLKAITEVANNKGYTLVGTTISGVNAFFVRNDVLGDKFTSNNSVEYLYNPPRYWFIYDHFWHIGHPADFGEYV